MAATPPSVPPVSGSTWTSYWTMISASSPFAQEILRCPSPAATLTSMGGKGGASAYFTFTDAVETLLPPNTELSEYCRQSLLVSGFADERLVTSGSSQGWTPASDVDRTMSDAERVAKSFCAVGVASRKVRSGGVVALVLLHAPLPLRAPIKRIRSVPVGVVSRFHLAISCRLLQSLAPIRPSWLSPLTVSVTARAARGVSAASRANAMRMSRAVIARKGPAREPVGRPQAAGRSDKLSVQA